MRIFVSGIAGLIGSNIANNLCNEQQIYGVDNLKFGYSDNLTGDIHWSIMGISDVQEIELNNIDVLVLSHCDNLPYSQSHPIETFKTNAFDTIKLIEKFNGKIIYLSTSSVYGQSQIIPTDENCEENLSNAYDQSKCIVEKYLKLRGNYTTLRLSNVYGVNQRPENEYCGVIGNFIGNALNDRHVFISGNGKDTRDYTYISDVVNAVKLAIEQDAKNTEINIGTGIETSILEIAIQIYNILQKNPKVLFKEKRLIDKINRRCLNINKAKELLGWEPEVKIVDGLKNTINWQIGEYM